MIKLEKALYTAKARAAGGVTNIDTRRSFLRNAAVAAAAPKLFEKLAIA